MPMQEGNGPTGGYGIRPANPANGIIVTNNIAPTTTPPKMPTKIINEVKHGRIGVGRLAGRGR